MTPEQGPGSGTASSSSGVGEELSHDAARLKDTAQQRVTQEAETRKSDVTRVAGSASSAIEKAASELESDENAPDWLGSAFRQAANGINQLASQIEGRNVNEIGQEVARFARSSPGTFLAASAAAGFAAARVLRAGVEHRHHEGSSDGTSGQGSSTQGMGTQGSGTQAMGGQAMGSQGVSTQSDTASDFNSGSSTYPTTSTQGAAL